MRQVLIWFALGLFLGLGFRHVATVEAQNPGIVFGSDSVAGTPSPISTDGSNALQVLGK